MQSRLLILFIFLPIFLFLCSCDIDNPLEGRERKERYDLPGNTIPDSLMEQIRFVSQQNVLYGYWLASNGERSGMTILFFGGNNDSMDDIWEKIVVLYDLGVNIFVFDYRGFGMSGGERSLEGLQADGLTALSLTLAREEVDQDSIIFYSYSIGNSVAFKLAAEHFNPFSIVAESPLAQENSFVNPFLVDGNSCNWLKDSGLNNIETVQEIEAPIMILCGAEDSQLRYDQNGRFIYWFAPDPKERIVIGEADHDNIMSVMDPIGFKNCLRKWFYYCSIF